MALSLNLPHSLSRLLPSHQIPKPISRFLPLRCSADPIKKTTLRTCKNCKTQFDPSLNHPRACRFHTAHFGGETKRKFESVYSGAPWILLTRAKFSNIGIVVVLKIPLTPDALLLLTPPMMTEVFHNLPPKNA